MIGLYVGFYKCHTCIYIKVLGVDIEAIYEVRVGVVISSWSRVICIGWNVCQGKALRVSFSE